MSRDGKDLMLNHLLQVTGASEEHINAMSQLQLDTEQFLTRRLAQLGVGRAEAIAVLGNILAIQLTHEEPDVTTKLCRHIPTLRGLYKGAGVG